MVRAKWIFVLLAVIIVSGIIYHCIDRYAWLFIHAGGTILLVAWTIHHFIRFRPRKKK